MAQRTNLLRCVGLAHHPLRERDLDALLVEAAQDGQVGQARRKSVQVNECQACSGNNYFQLAFMNRANNGAGHRFRAEGWLGYRLRS